MCVGAGVPNFRQNKQLLTFLFQICPKMDVGMKIQKTNVGIRICIVKNGFWGRNFKNLSPDLESAYLRYYVHQFSDKTNNFEILRPNLPKDEFWGRNFKNRSLDLDSTPPIYHVCQFLVKMYIF